MSDQTQMSQTSVGDDEIDLRELFIALWRGKWLISLCVAIAIALASFYLRTAEKKYTVSYVFKPVASEDTQPNLAGLGGLASFAGISLPTSGSGDFIAFKMLLKSQEVSELLMKDENLLKAVFINEWDPSRKVYDKPVPGTLTPYISTLKLILTGSAEDPYIKPNAARLADWISEEMSVSEDRDTGFLTLSSESAAPDLMLEIMSRLAAETDQLLKERFISTAEQTMTFYQSKLAAARAREHREALAKLIAQEDQKQMLASKGSYFVAEPLTTPSVSLYPTSPKASLVLALSVVLGGFFGAALVLIRKAIRS